MQQESEHTLFSLLACLVILLSILNLGSVYTTSTSVLGASIEAIDEDNNRLEYWNNIVSQNPSYLPGWINLSEQYFLLGQVDLAKVAALQAEKISPNCTCVLELKLKIGLEEY